MPTTLDPRVVDEHEKALPGRPPGGTAEMGASLASQPGLPAESDLSLRVLENMDALLVILDRQGNVVRFNKACERLFGYSATQVLAKLTTGELPLPKEAHTLKDLLIHMRQGKRAETYETEWRTQDGEARTIAWSIQALLDPRGEVEIVFATGADVTSRKQAEKLLKRQQRLLQGLIDSIPDLIFYKDRQGVYLGCNAAFTRFKSCAVQDIVGHTDAEIYTPALAKDFTESDQKVLTGGETIAFENWTEDADGNKILFETRKTPLYGLQGDVLGVIGIGRDITRHRTTENALRATNDEIENLISSLSSSLIVIDSSLHVQRWTQSAQALLGIPANQASGFDLGELPIPWDWKAVYDSLEKCRTDKRPVFPDPIRFQTKDGREGFLGVNISPIRVPAGNVIGFILLCNDITERKLMENRLAQGKRLESIGQLAAGIAHEINTPIQYVGDNTEFIQTSFQSLLALLGKYDQFIAFAKSGRLDADQIAWIEAAAEEADLRFLESEIPAAIQQSMDGLQRVAEIVGAMKEFSHPGGMEKTLHDLNQALQNTIAVARNEWKYVAEIETDFCPDLPKVSCFPGEINQVFLNVIVNAAQAIASLVEGSQEKGAIHLSTTWAGNWVEVRIRDTGPGIPEASQPRIFEPFFTTKEVGKGTGQGLAIAYDVVERKHGGTITFETALGKGTTFIIRLPIEPQPA